MSQRAALFDMDRTLVRKETASLYVRYQRELGEATGRDLAKTLYWVGLYTLGVLDAPRIAAKALLGLRGFPEIALAARCDDWFSRVVEVHVTDGGREAVRAHRARGELCAIVTGASPYAAWPLARRLEIEHVVSSEFEVDESGRFTGQPVSPFCFGEGKLARARDFARVHDVDLAKSAFYSDSITDLPLLEAVGEPIAVNPDLRLRRLAERRGWRIEAW